MSWDPEVYNKFKNERYQPFYDLLSLVEVGSAMEVIDLGCGTGELTSKLSLHLASSTVIGIDSSAEMLKNSSAYKSERVSFEVMTIEEVVKRDKQYDLVFSNAALQWVDDHEQLIPAVLSLVKPGGQLLVQVPSNDGHFTHRSLHVIADREPYRSALKGWKRLSPVLDIGTYAKMLFENGCTGINVFEKIYAHVLEDAEALYEWVSGTAMIRYAEQLPGDLKMNFINEYKAILREEYKDQRPVFYPFRRILFSAIKP